VDPLRAVKLTALMERTSGSPEVKIGLIDGPVVTRHPDLEDGRLREIAGISRGTCTQADSVACMHGTFVAGILSAKRVQRTRHLSRLYRPAPPHFPSRSQAGANADRDS
jgi:hypothetical protein